VYATHDGSVAAPTAGLHFTTALLARIHEQRTLVTAIDLHVGPGTFKPVETEALEQHTMHPEAFEIAQGAANWINDTRGKFGRSAPRWFGRSSRQRMRKAASGAGPGETSLFIRPPYDFTIVNHLITNFHLPRSTLLMLVCAFGRI